MGEENPDCSGGVKPYPRSWVSQWQRMIPPEEHNSSGYNEKNRGKIGENISEKQNQRSKFKIDTRQKLKGAINENFD
jgi:hypothetical protein